MSVGGSAARTWRLRANPGYELVLRDRLPAAQRQFLADDPGLYGLLRPRGGTELDVRTASPDTALLFLTLTQPAALPRYAAAQLGSGVEDAIGRLVLDGVLEVEHGETFVSGSRAATLVLPSVPDGGGGRVPELSAAAVRYGQELTHLSHEQLALRLYTFGHLPLHPELHRRLEGEDALRHALRIEPGGAAEAALARAWCPVPPRPGRHAHWHRWRPPRTATAPPTEAVHKLYISPATAEPGEVLATVATALTGLPGVISLKVGADVHGLCRPDKLVVHLERLADLYEAAALLRQLLAGCPAQGVPFTAPITCDGLLSWAVDPPPSAQERSWRAWVTARLAEYLKAADRAAHGGIAPWQLALGRLECDGLDTTSWVPTGSWWALDRAAC